MVYRTLILITKLAINALALLVVTSIFQGIHFDNNQAMIAAAVVLRRPRRAGPAPGRPA